MDRLPHDAKNAIVISMDGEILALWTGNPVLADQLRQADAEGVFALLLADNDNEIETVAVARRFYKREGADFSGWVVESNNDNSDPIANKHQAMRELRTAVADYFTRG